MSGNTERKASMARELPTSCPTTITTPSSLRPKPKYNRSAQPTERIRSWATQVRVMWS